MALAFGDGEGTTLDFEPPERLFADFLLDLQWVPSQSQHFMLLLSFQSCLLWEMSREKEQCLKPQSPLKNGELGRFGSAPVHKIQEELRG